MAPAPATIARIALGAAAALLVAVCAHAQTLTLGLKHPARSLDPHFYNLAANNALSRHIFESLVFTDENLAIRAGLAKSWRRTGETVWEFSLREGVKFHDGSEFTADDVMFSFSRVARIPNSPAGFVRYTRHIVAVDKVDTYTVRVKTDRPYSLLLHDLAGLRIMSLKAADGKTTDQINDGDGAVGTGPYRYSRWQPGKSTVLERNDDYWGAAQPWQTVIIQTIPEDKERVAALARKAVDLIDAVPTKNLKKLRRNRKLRLAKRISNHLIFLYVDSGRNSSPFVTGLRGKNPLRLPRVRKALSLAIDRKRITAKIMDGSAVPAGQFLPKGIPGAPPELVPDKFDPRAAKRLLARAGYPRGFGLTLHGPRGHFRHDAQVLAALAKGLRRIGIRAEAKTKPRRIYFPLAAKRQFSVFLAGWRLEVGDPAGPLRALLATPDGKRELGSHNFGGFSNTDLDDALKDVLRAQDDRRRTQLLQEATRAAIGNHGIIPLYFEVNRWALRKGLRFAPRTDGATLAMSVSPIR